MRDQGPGARDQRRGETSASAFRPTTASRRCPPSAFRFPLLFVAVSCLGISAFVTQLVLMRELMSAFSGNELVLGIVLGNWLLLTGMGAYLGRTAPRLGRPLAVLVVAEILVALLPIGDVLLLRLLRNVVFVRGAAVGATEIVAASFVLLAPYCLVAGYLLTLASMVLAGRRGPRSIGEVYFLDNVGDVVGGILFTFVLVYLFDHFQILYFPAVLNLLLACLVAFQFCSRGVLAAACTATATLLALVLCCDLEDFSLSSQYVGGQIVYHGNSPYGSLIVTKSSGQYNFIHNGVFLFSTHNIEEAEQTVHYAMAQRPDAKRVLLVSGGVSGTAGEILKYPVAALDYVELDPQIVEAARRFLPESVADPRIEVIHTDGRLFIRGTQRRYDVVLVDVPDPSTSQLNRFYTLEFFDEVKRKLVPGGVLSLSLGHYENYLSRELADLLATGHRTLSQEFDHVLMIPAGRVRLLASDGPLTLKIAERLQQQGIATYLMNRHYLSTVLAPDRMASLRRAISDRAPLNKDFSPVLYYYQLLYWMSQFKVRFGFLEAVLLAIIIACLVQLRPVSLAIFTAGLAASALEVVLLMGLQILYGCVYSGAGLIVTMFMLGLGIGSFAMNRMLPNRRRKDLAWLGLGIAIYAACLPGVLTALGRAGGGWAGGAASTAVIPLLALVLAVLVGLEFPLAGKVAYDSVASTAGRLYGADYLGAALGALVVSTLLIPVFGVTAVCWLAGGLNVASAAVIFFTNSAEKT